MRRSNAAVVRQAVLDHPTGTFCAAELNLSRLSVRTINQHLTHMGDIVERAGTTQYNNNGYMNHTYVLWKRKGGKA